MENFCFEIYTVNPATKETGWGIKNVVVIADDKKQAIRRIKRYPLFDCIITSNDWYHYSHKWPIWNGSIIVKEY